MSRYVSGRGSEVERVTYDIWSESVVECTIEGVSVGG